MTRRLLLVPLIAVLRRCRRPLARVTAGVLTAVLIVSAPVAVPWAVAETERLVYIEGSKDLIERFYDLAEQLSEREQMTSRGDMVLWALEILQYFPDEVSSLRVPYDALYFWPSLGVAGRAACQKTGAQGPVFLNLNYANPHSPWYGDEWAVWVMVHELLHVQGGPFCSGPAAVLEARTETASLEVLAAMANDGNEEVLRPLLMGVVGRGLQALEAEIGREAVRRFRERRLGADALRLSIFDKDTRFWAVEEGRQALIERYAVVPWQAWLESAQDGTAELVQIANEPLAMDDWRYFYEHAEELVAATVARR